MYTRYDRLIVDVVVVTVFGCRKGDEGVFFLRPRSAERLARRVEEWSSGSRLAMGGVVEGGGL